jgi:ABC-type multidrug transport system fused ATPase/permease subunit
MAKNYAELNSKNPNDLTSKILAEVEKLVLSFYQPLADVISATMTTALVFVVLISVNATVTFSSLGLIALIYIIIYRYSKSEIHKLGLERSVATEKRFKFVIEMFSAVREIKISDNLDFYLKKFKNNSKRLGKSYTKINVIGHVPYFLLQMIILSGIIFICVFLLSSSNMNQEDFVSRLFPLLGVFAFAGQRLMPEINKIFQGATQIKYGMQAMKEMVLEIENYKKRPSFYLDGKAVGEPFQKIELKNVSYTFPNQGKPAVVDINLEIKSGQKILIQGKTGSGKSTLVSLLCGLIMPSKGNIILNNDALDALKIKLFHKDLGYVPQEIAIFDGTIVDNITFGESAENLDMKKVENAAKIASLHDFIMEELPAGYNSKLGDKGSSFSGGQRQRVGIARAIYRDPKILILDEATSALDAETEALVMSNIMLALADRTVISISHSSGQMRYFDSSIQLKGGIVQSNNISLVNN